jgi:hypothetical protein
VLLLAGSVALMLSAPFQNNLTTQEARGAEESRYTSFARASMRQATICRSAPASALSPKSTRATRIRKR